MRSPGVLFLLFGLFVSPVTMSQNLGQESGDLEILKASAHVKDSELSGRTRTFTLTVKNTGEQAINSLTFQFDILLENAAEEPDETLPRNRCGFILTDLNIQPGDVFTVQRTLSGDHCIPESSVKQAVRIQEIQYEDGTIWKDSPNDETTWRRVKMPRIGSVVTEEGASRKPTP